MKRILAGLAVMTVSMSACAQPTIPEILDAKPFVSMDLKGDPRAASKCVVGPIDELGWHTTVRDFGEEVQVVWHMGSKNQPFAIFSLSPLTPGRSKVEGRTKVDMKDPAKMTETWKAKLAHCQ